MTDRYLDFGEGRSVAVIQQWVTLLPWKMQTVIIQGLRAPDTHFCEGVKNVCRWMRSVVLNNADKSHTFMCTKQHMPNVEDLENELNYCSFHFVSHFLYALEIISYKHPDSVVRRIAGRYYVGFVEEMSHLKVESEEQLDVRLSDVEEKVEPEIEPVIECPVGRRDTYTWRV